MANKILFLPGDGIGSEIMSEVYRVMEWLSKKRGISFDLDEDLVGGVSCDKHKVPITDAVVEKAMNAGTVMLGAVGGPQYDDLPFHSRPEQGLLRLRKDMELFANLRPALCFDALVTASSLKPDLVSGLDILILRELTGGVYFGEPRGIHKLANNQYRAVDTQVYETSEIKRIAKLGFELASRRRGLLHSVEKSNVMHTGVLWKQEVQRLHDESFPHVDLHHMLADNCAMQLVRQPKQFDVIVTDNLFGDILSDVAAMLTGSLGMLPSASLSATDEEGKRLALYEPVHGSAPDIAGQNKANPLACILSFAMALRYSFNLPQEAALIESAVKEVLKTGRTGDTWTEGTTLLGCTGMGDAVIKALNMKNDNIKNS